jgi:molecular chaperone GrpE
MSNTNHDETHQPDEPVQEAANQEKEQPTVTIQELQLDQFKKEAADYKDKYIRLLAESENARKRLQKERQEMVQYAQQNIIIDFLGPIDHMETALKHAKQMSEEVRHWAIGFEMILEQFKGILANNGVFPFDSKGHPFDPHRHEAVEMIETLDYSPGIVVEETIRGYKMGDRTIRPARVSVAKMPAKKDPEEALPLTENTGEEPPKE